MKLSNIRDILAVAEAGSLRGGSRKLGITQPSMSRSIRDTEHELGVSLFHRHGHGVTLTRMGQVFVQHATAIQSEIRHIFEAIEQEKGRANGEIAVAMSTAATIALMPTMLRVFQTEYPKVLLKFTESLLFEHVEQNLLSGEVDFFVGPVHNFPVKTPLVFEKLFDNRFDVIGRRGHPLAGARTLQELQGARWIRPLFADHQRRPEFEALFSQAGLPLPEVSVHMHSVMMTLLAVTSSDLLALLPVQWLESAFCRDQVVAFPLAETLRAGPVYIVRRGDLPLTPLAERLCDVTLKAGLNYALKH
ncbi:MULTISPECIES: LysR substrate-binding domain-containing protein [Sphingobium]|uniref:LysR substrate-binding domain-containing protein n=1 Tax=Sphingobium TaxID=165695 RepID=UPI00159C06D5|nr:LysR substrate-binding domain-containing protein [Sphingobium sp. 15-1]